LISSGLQYINKVFPTLPKIKGLEKQQVKVLLPTAAKQTKNPNRKPKQNQIFQLITKRFRFCAFVINLFLAANCSKSKVTQFPSLALISIQFLVKFTEPLLIFR